MTLQGFDLSKWIEIELFEKEMSLEQTETDLGEEKQAKNGKTGQLSVVTIKPTKLNLSSRRKWLFISNADKSI